MKQHWTIKNRELHPFWRLTDTSRWTGQFLKQKVDGWSSHWNFWPKCHLDWTHAPAQWHQQSTPTERQLTVLHCWVHCSITSGKSFLWDMQRGTTAWSYWCSCFTTVHEPLVCQIHSLQAKRGLIFPSAAVFNVIRVTESVFHRHVVGVGTSVPNEKKTDLKIQSIVFEQMGTKVFSTNPAHFFDHRLGEKETTHLCWSWSFQNASTWGWQHTARSSMSWLSMWTNYPWGTHSQRLYFSKISKDKRTCMYICT